MFIRHLSGGIHSIEDSALFETYNRIPFQDKICFFTSYAVLGLFYIFHFLYTYWTSKMLPFYLHNNISICFKSFLNTFHVCKDLINLKWWFVRVLDKIYISMELSCSNLTGGQRRSFACIKLIEFPSYNHYSSPR